MKYRYINKLNKEVGASTKIEALIKLESRVGWNSFIIEVGAYWENNFCFKLHTLKCQSRFFILMKCTTLYVIGNQLSNLIINEKF